MSKYDGGPAFGTTMVEQIGRSLNVTGGLSLRDYFAASVIHMGLHPDFMAHSWTEEECENQIINASVLSYRLADAMLAERAK